MPRRSKCQSVRQSTSSVPMGSCSPMPLTSRSPTRSSSQTRCKYDNIGETFDIDDSDGGWRSFAVSSRSGFQTRSRFQPSHAPAYLRYQRAQEELRHSQLHSRAALETFGLVHEHKYVMAKTSRVRWQKLRKKLRCGPWVVAPISMTATPGAFAGGGGRAVAVSSTRTTTAEVSAGHRFPRSL